MSNAKILYSDLYNLENDLRAVCEKLAELGRCTKRITRWGHDLFRFEDGSAITFGTLGPMYS